MTFNEIVFYVFSAILVLSALTVAGRIFHTWRELEGRRVAA